METKEDMIEIDVELIFKKIWRKKIGVFLAGFLFAVCFFVYSKYIKPPIYESKTKIYSVQSYDAQNITFQDLQIGTDLVADYQQIILSSDVLSQVIEKEGLSLSMEELAKKIRIQSPAGTRVLEISVIDHTSQGASDIANTLREQSVEKIKQITKIKEIAVIEEARPSMRPLDTNLKKHLLLAFGGGVGLVMVLLIFQDLMDDRVKRREDVEEMMGLVLLGVLPLCPRGASNIRKRG